MDNKKNKKIIKNISKNKRKIQTVFLNNIYILILIPILIYIFNEIFLNAFTVDGEVFKVAINMIINILQIGIPFICLILYLKNKKEDHNLKSDVSKSKTELSVYTKFNKLYGVGILLSFLPICSNIIIQKYLGVNYISILSIITLICILGITVSTTIYVYEIVKRFFKEIIIAPILSIIVIYTLNYFSQYFLFRKTEELSVFKINSGLYLGFTDSLYLVLVFGSIIYTILVVLLANKVNSINNIKNIDDSKKIQEKELVEKTKEKIEDLSLNNDGGKNDKKQNNNDKKDENKNEKKNIINKLFKIITKKRKINIVMNIIIFVLITILLILTFNMKEKISFSKLNNGIDIDERIFKRYAPSNKLKQALNNNKKEIIIQYSGKKYEQLMIQKVKNMNNVLKDKKIKLEIYKGEDLVSNENTAEVLIVKEKEQKDNVYLIDLSLESTIIGNDEKIYTRLDDEIAVGINMINLEKRKKTFGILTNENSYKKNSRYDKIDLETKGIYIKKVSTKNKQEINSVGTLIIPIFTKDLNEEETKNIIEFIQNGGNIVCVKMPQNTSEKMTNINKILALYAVKVSDDEMLLEQDDNYRYKNIRQLTEKEIKENQEKQNAKKEGQIKKFAEEVYNNSIIYPEVTEENDVGKLINMITPIKPLTLINNSVIELEEDKAQEKQVKFKKLLLPSNDAKKVKNAKKEDVLVKKLEKGEKGNFVLGVIATKTVPKGVSKLFVISGELNLFGLLEQNQIRPNSKSIEGKEFLIGNLKELIFDNHNIELVNQKEKVLGETTKTQISKIRTVETATIIISVLIYLVVYVVRNRKKIQA